MRDQGASAGADAQKQPIPNPIGPDVSPDPNPDIARRSRQMRFQPVASGLLRGLLIGVGWLAVALGFAGIFLPVMPTTPFLLLAAACFLRSSQRFYDWLTGHPRLGPYLIYYLDGQGMPYRAKLYTLLLMWTSMGMSAWLVSRTWVTLFMLLSGIGVSLYIARLPTRKPPSPQPSKRD